MAIARKPAVQPAASPFKATLDAANTALEAFRKIPKIEFTEKVKIPQDGIQALKAVANIATASEALAKAGKQSIIAAVNSGAEAEAGPVELNLVPSERTNVQADAIITALANAILFGAPVPKDLNAALRKGKMADDTFDYEVFKSAITAEAKKTPTDFATITESTAVKFK